MLSSQPLKSLSDLRRNFEELAKEYLDSSPIEGFEQGLSIATALSSVLRPKQPQAIPPLLRPWIHRIVEIRNSPHLFVQERKMCSEFQGIFTRCLQATIQTLSSSSPQLPTPENSGPIPGMQEGALLRLTDPGIGCDEEYLLSSLKEDVYSLTIASPALLNNEAFMLQAIQRNPKAFLYASKELQRQRSFQIEAAACNGLVLAYMNEELRNDSTILFEATLCNPWAVFFAGDQIKNEHSFNLRAVQIQPRAIRYIPPSVRYNRSFLIEAVSATDGMVLEWLGYDERHDKSLMLKAIGICLNSMKHLAPEVKGDGEFLLDAIQIDERAYLHISDHFKSSLRFNLAAAGRNGLVLQFLSKESCKITSIALAALQNKPSAAHYLKDTLMMDFAFVLEAVQKNGLVLHYAPLLARGMKAIVLAAVRNNGLALIDASDEMKNNSEIVHAAITQNPEAALFAGPTLQSDPIVRAALRSLPKSPASHNQSAVCTIV
jgi:hypothetical protein